MRGIPIVIGIVLSLVWVVGVWILRPPIGIQLDCDVFLFYCFIGPVVIALAIIFLYWIDRDLFGSTVKAAPLGGIFVAIFGFFGNLISAERETRRPFLEKQLESCVKLAEATETLAASAAGEERSNASNKLWVEAWSRLAIFSDAALEGVVKEFADLQWFNGDLHDAAHCVGRMCRVMVHVCEEDALRNHPDCTIPGRKS